MSIATESRYEWRVTPFIDNLGNQMWALEKALVWRNGKIYSWERECVFRNEERAFAELRERQAEQVPPAGIEPAAYPLGEGRSIH